LYAVPLFPDFPTMQYRRDLVKEAGYDPEGENWATESMTWKRFSKITKDVVETTGTRYGFTFQADVYEGLACCDFNEFMSGWGGAYFGGLENLFGPIGDRPVTVDEDAVLNSVKMIRTFLHGPDAANTLDGYAGPISPQGVLQWTEEPSRKPFTSGDAVMHRNWPYSIIINGADDVFGTDLGVMPIPYAVSETDAKYDGTGGPVAALGGWHMTVNPNSRDLDACRAVLRAMMKREFKLKLFQAVGLIPPEPKILEPDAVTEIPVIGRHIDAIRVAGQNAVPRPVRAVWPLESTKTAQSVHAAYAGDGAPSEALASLKRDLGMIERYNQSP
ncbi:MAG: extracellular solute-binding protein, partial [Salinigranum sp.]